VSAQNALVVQRGPRGGRRVPTLWCRCLLSLGITLQASLRSDGGEKEGQQIFKLLERKLVEQQPLDKGAKRAGGDVDEVSERPVFSVNGADGVKCSQRKRSFRLLSGNFSNGTAHVRERTGKGALPEHVSVARGGGRETLAGCMGWRAAGDPQRARSDLRGRRFNGSLQPF
jgi:hypothetical protein